MLLDVEVGDELLDRWRLWRFDLLLFETALQTFLDLVLDVVNQLGERLYIDALRPIVWRANLHRRLDETEWILAR